MSFLSNGYSVKYIPIDYAPRAGRSKFHWWRDTRRYLRQVIRMVLLYNPLKFFLPFGGLLLVGGLGKLAFDLATKEFRVATNTIAVLAAAAGILIVALLADLLVQVNKRPDPVLPAADYED